MTLAVLPFRVLERFPKPDTLCRCGESDCTRLSNQQFFDHVRAFSLGLRAIGLEAGDRVALASESRPEWVVSDLAVITAGAVTVPLYPTLSAPQMWFILNETEARIAIVSNAAQVAKIREVDERSHALRTIVVIDGEVEPGAFRVLTMADVVAIGARTLAADPGTADRYRDEAAAVSPDALATIVYTSGTTGDPKGVMLTHRNIVSNVIATQGWIALDPTDRLLSFLPLSHVFERVVLFRCLYDGVSVYFAETMTSVARDLQRVRPTAMTGVPRAWEKFHGAIQDGLARIEGPRKKLAEWAIGVGYESARVWLSGGTPSPLLKAKRAVADRLVFAKIRERLGGKIRFLVSGSAPLSPKIGEFFFAINVPILEAYGLTESSPGISGNPLAAPRLGTVGKLLPGVEVRIGPDGEILVRGPNIMQGYYKRPEATAETLADGWLHTGDIGELSADGYLDDHRPKEGPDRDVGRQEDRAAAAREPAEDGPARLRGGADRRAAQVPRGPAGARLREARSADRGDEAPRGVARRAGPPPRGAPAVPGGPRSPERQPGAVRAREALRAAADRVHDGARGADADDEGETAGRRAAVAPLIDTIYAS